MYEKDKDKDVGGKTKNNTPGAEFTFRRNYCYKFSTKNYETTLVFMEY